MPKFFLFLCCSLSSLIFSNEAPSQDDRAQLLIEHVQKCLDNANQGSSKLTKEVLAIQGMSSPKVRYLLNNLCSLPNTNYLEIGVWKGSTWISALFGNEATLSSAVAIDNWSQFAGTESDFLSNCSVFIPYFQFNSYSADCFNLNVNSTCKSPVNIYFFDGDHSPLAQELAFTYYDSVLDDVFIAVVDDWNYPPVQDGTYAAFKKLNYTILYEIQLPAKSISDLENWWNGLYVAVIRKARSTEPQ